MTAIPLAIDGFLDTEPVPAPGDTAGITAQFRVIVSPTDHVTEETVLPCTTGDPRLAHALLTDLQPGDLLRVSGFLTLPDSADGIIRLHVDALEVLTTVPLRTTSEAEEFVFDRYGAYIAISSSDTSAVQMWTEAGTWVGTATDPAAIDGLIAAYEKATRNP